MKFEFDMFSQRVFVSPEKILSYSRVLFPLEYIYEWMTEMGKGKVPLCNSDVTEAQLKHI